MSSEKLLYIPNFLDCSHYTPDYNTGSYFLYFGRLAPEKGVDPWFEQPHRPVSGCKLREPVLTNKNLRKLQISRAARLIFWVTAADRNCRH